MKPYYADYVNHILRFYVRKQTNSFKNDVDKQNYIAADKVVKKITVEGQKAIRFIFSQESISVADNVTEYARLTNGNTKELWSLVSYVTNKVAKERNLI